MFTKIKYIVTTLLMLVSFSSHAGDMGDIGELLHLDFLNFKYMQIRIDGSAICDTFYAGTFGCSYENRKNNESIFNLLYDDNDIYDKTTVIKANSDSINYFSLVDKSTFDGTITMDLSNRLDHSRLIVYFPKTEMIYVTGDLDFKYYHTYNDIKVTGNSDNLFEYSKVPRKLIIDALLGLVVCLTISFISMLIFMTFEFKPLAYNAIVIFCISLAYWLVTRITLIYNSFFTVLNELLLYCILLPIVIFATHAFLKINGERHYRKTFFYSFLVSVIMIFIVNISVLLCI